MDTYYMLSAAMIPSHPAQVPVWKKLGLRHGKKKKKKRDHLLQQVQTSIFKESKSNHSPLLS